ncbi:hypothetical protein [Devosia sp. Root635]|uniref:hypothetical protein n=1 Tax=Devosia sp. Root635 TaxID=1736575 RepID=UPI0006F28874|nr:hypothetical protein [Devosia sp. Root635]KRA50214.1 hypothetical protein ASD80_16805 [Devosia sp. Root635]
MSIDRRITNGLAWAGVILVVGVPTADLLSAQFTGNSATPAPAQVAVIEPVAPTPAPLSQRPAAPVAAPATEVAVVAPVVKPVAIPAVVKPAVTPAAETADAVDAFLQSGRALPSYITGAEAPAAPSQVAATPPGRTPIVTPTEQVDPVEVAAIPPQKIAPVPMPLSMRPQPVAVALVRDPVVIPPGLTPASPAGAVRPPANVTAADLDDWETGPLSDFLAQRQAGNAYFAPTYDADGFFLDQGPNRSRARVIAREEAPFLLFAD